MDIPPLHKACSSSIKSSNPVFNLLASIKENILQSLFNNVMGLQLSIYNLFLLGLGISVITPCLSEAGNSCLFNDSSNKKEDEWC